MRPFLEHLSALREIVGTRRTHVQGFPTTRPALLYFMLDITPAPYLMDREFHVVNPVLQEQASVYFAEHLSEVECIICIDLEAPEVRLFLKANPRATLVERSLDGCPYWVVLKP